MDSTYYHQEPLTIPVQNLSVASSFYVNALRPLGYHFISQTQHQTANGTYSNAVGLGPQNFSRVDLFLSQSAHGARTSKPAHVVFPAGSRTVVREFYAAALNAGGKLVERPHLQGSEGIFGATVADVDGHKIEVSTCEAVTQATEAQNAGDPASVPEPQGIQRWRTDVAESTVSGSAPSKSAHGSKRGTVPPAGSVASSKAHSQTQSRKDGAASNTSGPTSKGKTAPPPSSTIDVGGKKVVGTILGAAAGAALAYTMVRSKQDSGRREDDFASRMAARERVKTEASAHAPLAQTMPVYSDSERRDKSRSIRRYSLADRDSGYYSAGSRGDGSSPERAVHRSVTYPQAGSTQYAPSSSHGRSRSRRLIEYEPRPIYDEPETMPQDQGRQSSRLAIRNGSEASQSTVKPSPNYDAASSRSRARNTTVHTIRPPSPPPSMPAPPPTRPRRDSSASHSRSRSQQPPSRFSESKAAGVPLPPSSYHSTRNTLQRSNSAAGASAAHQSARRSNADYATVRSYRPEQAPPSDSGSHESSRPRASAIASRGQPASRAPPSCAPLTARALSSYSAHSWGKRSAFPSTKLDDMETLVPDDSISVR
ncbi:MAG: hypothetical protein M1831_005734 [Alyxoria varia]|nr:MAG: hypothetical protein M1831_005734 [Alyxoria varia]